MIKLCGVGISNYYNKVKLVLLEKEIDFEEEKVFPSQSEDLIQRSALGKIPFLETEHGILTESQVIVEYLEDNFPAEKLYPSDAFERAKCRELIQHIELNIELQARRLYKEALFGGSVSDETKAEVKEKLTIGLSGLARLVKFSPFICGEQFTAADCVAWIHFYYVQMTIQKIYGTDLVQQYLPALNDYMQMLEQRPAFSKVAADRAAALDAFFKK